MNHLPNDCSCSELTVTPKDWKTNSNTIKRKWHIQYYFYDPFFKDDPKYKYGKFVIIKGMNRLKTISERRGATKELIANELLLLREEGYNPITGQKNVVLKNDYEIEPTCYFIEALRKAFLHLKLSDSTKADVKCVLKGFEKSVNGLGLYRLSIQDVRRKHVKQALENCESIIDGWSANRFNKYRSYLQMMFKELVELETIEFNPVNEISKKKTTTKIRTILSLEERKAIDVHLKNKCRNFWLFVNIFFHSGSREIELLRLKGIDVDLENQRFKCLIKKRSNYSEVYKPIKDIALNLWKEIMATCQPSDYVFSVGLIPGPKTIRREQISRRWNWHVKRDLQISADLYSLKHSNLDETAMQLDAAAAAKMAGHTSTVITLKHYLVNEEERKMEKLRKVNNDFA